MQCCKSIKYSLRGIYYLSSIEFVHITLNETSKKRAWYTYNETNNKTNEK